MSVCDCPLGRVCRCAGPTPAQARIAELEKWQAEAVPLLSWVTNRSIMPAIVQRAMRLLALAGHSE